MPRKYENFRFSLHEVTGFSSHVIFVADFLEFQFARRSFCCGFFGRFSLHDVIFVADFLELRLHSDRCWWCDTGQRQSRFHFVARCPAWAGQARAMWKRIGRLCEKRGPVTPSVRAMFGIRELLGMDGFGGSSGMDGGGRRAARERRAGRARPRMHFPFVSFLC